MMKYGILISTLTLICIFAGCTPQTDTAETAVQEQQKFDPANMENIVREAMAAADVPGVSIAVLQNGEVAWSSAFGVKSAESGEPVEADTLFEAASLSKPVFAYAVLKLVDAGEFDLDKPLLDYVDQDYIVETFFETPPSDERMKEITPRMVLSHSSGLPNWRRRGKELDLRNPPGEKFSYSGEGFVWLQRVVEKLRGKSLDAFVREMVFEPLDMPNSAYIWRDEFESQAASRHDFTGKVTRSIKSERENAASSLITCADDYARFMAAVLSGEGLSDESLELIFTPRAQVAPDRNDGIAWSAGFGLSIDDDDTVLWHWGDNGDSKAFMAASRKTGNGIVYFANSYNGLGMLDRIVGNILGEDNPVFKTTLMTRYPRIGSPLMTLMVLVKKGAPAVLEAYREMVEENGGDVTSIKESVLNVTGYLFMEIGDKEGAIEILIENTKAYPESANVWDSLGEAYFNAGQRDVAIANYKKALEIDPELATAKRFFEKLEAEQK